MGQITHVAVRNIFGYDYMKLRASSQLEQCPAASAEAETHFKPQLAACQSLRVISSDITYKALLRGQKAEGR
jgi:hypothetical protein